MARRREGSSFVRVTAGLWDTRRVFVQVGNVSVHRVAGPKGKERCDQGYLRRQRGGRGALR